MKWRKQIEGNMRRFELKKEDTADQCKWRSGMRRVKELVSCIRPPLVTGD